MAPSKTRKQGKLPDKATPRRNPVSQSSDNNTPIPSDTPRRTSRVSRSQSLSSPATNLRRRATKIQTNLVDNDSRSSGEDSPANGYDDASSSTSGVPQSSPEEDHLLPPVSGAKPPLVKKRRRLSVRPDASQPSQTGLHGSTSSQGFASRLAQTSAATNRTSLANTSDHSHHGRLLRYTDAHVQTNPHDNFNSEYPQFANSLQDSSLGNAEAHAQQELQNMLRHYAPRLLSEVQGLNHQLPTIPGTNYPMPPLWDPPSPLANPLGIGGRGWPPNVAPVEIFEHVSSSLSRDDLLSMRLVNHEFEAKLSSRIFQTVVVPFKPDIYGMADNNGKIVLAETSSGRQANGEGPQQPVSTVTLPSPGRPLSDGMEVFRLWGKRIKKFAFTFELDEETFYKLPAKDYYEDQVSFWGKYKWPRAEYTRFKSCEQLEKKADETRCMTLALSQLTSLNELGLVVDSGLGWIEGPDRSDRVHLLAEKQPIFGSTYLKPSRSQRNKQFTWDAIVMESKRNQGFGQERFGPEIPASERLIPHQYQPTTFQTIHGPYYEAVAIPSLAWAQVPVKDVHPPLIFRGLDVERGTKDTEKALCPSSYPSDALIPNELKYSHIEWLMENEWAQQAFLTSLTISVTDNASNLQNIQTLNIAKLSSRYLTALSNQDFWAALPNLQTLKMFISPDWRDIVRGSDEVLQAAMICPSSAGKQFYDFLETCVAKKESITSLDIGWLGGGERATGLFARNQHILPAPVLSFTDPEAAHLSCKVLKLPFVKHLALTNCWFHPSALKVFVRRMEQANLQTLKLDSVSLTALANTANVNNHNHHQPVVNIPHVNIPHVNGHLLPPPPGLVAINHGNVQPPPAGYGQHGLGNNVNQQLPTAGYPYPAMIAPMAGTFHLQPQSIRPSRGASEPQDILSSLNAFHPYMQFPGRAVVNATVPRGGHLSHWAAEQLAPDISCLEETHRNGSWGEVIDKITPGKTIDQQRTFSDDSAVIPKARKPTSLQRVEFTSCGYVRLTHHRTMAQNTLAEVMSLPPRCLRHRHKVLSKIMMKANHDVLLGTIAPAMPQQESDVLQVAFNMRMGWEENDMSQYEPREDGQPIGGSGRFSGVVERSAEPEDSD